MNDVRMRPPHFNHVAMSVPPAMLTPDGSAPLRDFYPEVFGWRHFANRRELAGCLGLAPTPYASGDSQIEQGISKAGNKRARALLVELAWGWLRLTTSSGLLTPG